MKKYIIGSLLMFGIIVSNASFAQVAKAEDVIAPPSTCVSLNSNLRYRDRDVNKNGEVTVLQNFLRSNNYTTFSSTGYFGILTLKGVKSFQKSNGVNPTGFVGSITRAKIKSLTCSSDSASPLSINPASSTIKVGDSISAEARFNSCPVGSQCFVGPLPVIATWTSSNNTVATVEYKASITPSSIVSITGISEGIVNISASYTDGSGKVFSASSRITVVGSTAVSSPTISSISPSSGVIGTQVVINGSGFTATGNKIKFSNLGTENNPTYNLNSSDGRTLTFNVPSTNYLACWNTTPACNAPVIMVQPGVYEVTVINVNGTSNVVNFTVTSGSSTACEYPNPPLGYHYEGIQPYPTCGGYLVAN